MRMKRLNTNSDKEATDCGLCVTRGRYSITDAVRQQVDFDAPEERHRCPCRIRQSKRFSAPRKFL